ncbi:olfactory receptor 5AR1-like [Rhinophrynus dorsalis]
MRGNVQNITLEREFHLLVFSSFAEFRHVIFIGVLLVCLLVVLGNIIIIVLICLVSQLHSPMYFFLCNLSVQDIVYVSAILPKLMDITITGYSNISFPGCITQIVLFILCIDTEFFLLTSMAYDRYVAICIPLCYTLIMNKNLCLLMTAVSWVFGVLNSFQYSLLMSQLSFCYSKEINHFFCEVKTMLHLSCSDTTIITVIISVECVFLGFLPFVLIITSYAYIISTILNIQSSAGRQNTFSSCSSHLTIVLLFCGTSLSLYLKPESEHFQEQDKLLSILYIAVVPMLNPLVYSLRNKEILKAMKKVTAKCVLNASIKL